MRIESLHNERKERGLEDVNIYFSADHGRKLDGGKGIRGDFRSCMVVRKAANLFVAHKDWPVCAKDLAGLGIVLVLSKQLRTDINDV